MKKLIQILLLAPFTIYSQEKTTVSKTNIGFSVTPEFNSLMTGNRVEQENIKSKFGFSTALNLEFKLTPKTSIRTGVGYGKKKYDVIQSGLVFGSDINPQTGFSANESKLESQVSFSEMQIPLIFNYELNNPEFFIAGGMEITYSFGNNSEKTIYYGSGDIEKLSSSNENGLNFAPVLSVGYKVPVSDKASISIEPMFKYYLKEYISVYSHLYNVGLRTTFTFQ